MEKTKLEYSAPETISVEMLLTESTLITQSTFEKGQEGSEWGW